MTMCLRVRKDMQLIMQFAQYRSVLAMFYQHYLGDGILQPPIEFGNKHSYRTRQSPWFVNIPRYKKCFSQNFFQIVTRQLHGETQYHLFFSRCYQPS